MLRTTSVSPLDRDKDTVLDPRKMLRIFPYLKLKISKLCGTVAQKPPYRSYEMNKKNRPGNSTGRLKSNAANYLSAFPET